MSDIVTVKLWGTVIGYLGYVGHQTEVAQFEYAPEFKRSGINLSPLLMADKDREYTFTDISQRTFKGVPGFIADSLPDKYGTQLIDLYFEGVKQHDITTLDRLLYIGSRGMGALTYHPGADLNGSKDGVLDLNALAGLAQMITSRKDKLSTDLLGSKERGDAIQHIKVSSSAGGARAKALIALSSDGTIKDGTQDHGTDHRYYLIKFDTQGNKDRDHEDPKGMTKVESVYADIARECGINIPDTSAIEISDDYHFLIERFDLIKRQTADKSSRLDKLHYVSWSGMAHAHRDATGVYGYEQLALVVRQLNLGQQTLNEVFRRAVFNVVGRNQDDHTKNIGFLMDRSGQWSLAPAFDLTYSYDPQGMWTSTHQVRLSGKQDGFTRDDLLRFASFCDVKDKVANEIIDKTCESFSSFKAKAQKLYIDNDLIELIDGNLRLSL